MSSIFLIRSFARSRTDPVKLLTLNLRHGGGTRIKEIIKFLAVSSAEVIVLTEFRNNLQGKLILDWLDEAGWQWTTPKNLDPRQNTVLIAAHRLNEYELPLPPNSWSLIAAELDHVLVVGTYMPGKSEKESLFEWMFDFFDGRQRTLLIGDLNTGLNDLDLEGKSKFWCENEFRILSTDLMHDAFRLVHGQTQEYSWVSNRGNGFRIDHLLVSEDLETSVSEVMYIHETRDRISDHSCLFAELSV